jgi:pimeloyl-ACP methyl ester carboxylesterase
MVMIATLIKKSVKILTFLTALILGVGFAFAYHVLRNAMYRQEPSAVRKDKILLNYQKLVAAHRAQEVSIKTADGIDLSALLIVRPKATRVVILCHGYRMTKEEMEQCLNVLPNDSFLLFDFRAHGKSSGDVVSFGYHEQKDVDAVVKFLRHNEHTKKLPIIGFGVSMGGATLLAAAAYKNDFKALIIDSSFASLSKEAEDQFANVTGLPRIVLPFVQIVFEFLAGCKMTAIVPAELIKGIQCPILIIHSRNDMFTFVSHAYALFENATTQFKKLWLVDDSCHGAAYRDYPEEYADCVKNFLKQYA